MRALTIIDIVEWEAIHGTATRWRFSVSE
jgi:hypothetical protein